MDRPKSEIKLQQKEVKKRGAREVKEEQGEPVKASVKPARQFDKQDQHITRPGPQIGKSDKVQAETPKEPAQKFERRMTLEKTAESAPKPEVVSPDRPTPLPERQTPKRPAQKSEAVYPAKPGHPLPKSEMTDNQKNGNSGDKTERVNPVKPGRPVVKPDGVAPHPSSKPENVKPVRPGPYEKPQDTMPVQPTSKKEGTRVWL
jgi:hypothetical protein